MIKSPLFYVTLVVDKTTNKPVEIIPFSGEASDVWKLNHQDGEYEFVKVPAYDKISDDYTLTAEDYTNKK